MKRRDFIAGLAGAAAFSVQRPTSASAQPSGRPRRIAVLMGVREGDPEGVGPAQAPTKYQLALNLPTARRQNFMFPPTLLALADEVVE